MMKTNPEDVLGSSDHKQSDADSTSRSFVGRRHVRIVLTIDSLVVSTTGMFLSVFWKHDVLVGHFSLI